MPNFPKDSYYYILNNYDKKNYNATPFSTIEEAEKHIASVRVKNPEVAREMVVMQPVSIRNYHKEKQK